MTVACDSSCGNSLSLPYEWQAYLEGIDFYFRNAVWTDADQSGVGLSYVTVPVQRQQKDSNSIGV
jgi:hypothetical protein